VKMQYILDWSTQGSRCFSEKVPNLSIYFQISIFPRVPKTGELKISVEFSRGAGEA
jgi:hypothetical protein